MNERVGNFASYTQVLAGERFTVFSPFLSRDLLTSSRVLRGRPWKDDTLQRKMIEKNSDPLARIPLDSGRSIRSRGLDAIPAGLRRGVWVSKILSNRFVGKRLFTTYFTDYPRWIRERDYDSFARSVNDGCRALNDLLDEKAVIAAMDGFRTGDEAHFQFLVNLAGIETFLYNMKLRR